MTDFTELDLNKDVSEMDGDEAKETLIEFMEAHQENQEAYDETVSEFEDRIDEVQEEKESLEATVGELKNEYAEEAAEHVNMPAELLVKRFNFDEIRQILEDAAEFAESEEEEDEEDGPGLTEFSDRDPKGQTGGEEDGSYGFRDKAAKKLGNHGIDVE